MGTPDTFPHLFWGYAAIWTCLVVYLFLIRAQQGRMSKEIERLAKVIGIDSSSAR